MRVICWGDEGTGFVSFVKRFGEGRRVLLNCGRVLSGEILMVVAIVVYVSHGGWLCLIQIIMSYLTITPLSFTTRRTHSPPAAT